MHPASDPPRGIDGLIRFVAQRSYGDRHKGLFWAACRAAEGDLNLDPLVTAAVIGGIPQSDAERSVECASETIARARKDHEVLDPS